MPKGSKKTVAAAKRTIKESAVGLVLAKLEKINLPVGTVVKDAEYFYPGDIKTLYQIMGLLAPSPRYKLAALIMKRILNRGTTISDASIKLVKALKVTSDMEYISERISDLESRLDDIRI